MRRDLLPQVAIKRAPSGGIRVEVGVTIHAADGVALVCESKSARVMELSRKRPDAEVSLMPGDGVGKFSYRIDGAAPSHRWASAAGSNNRAPMEVSQFKFYTTLPPVRHPPQSGWLDGLGRLKGGRWLYLGVARCAPLFTVQN
jgi:hypothetical protein